MALCITHRAELLRYPTLGSPSCRANQCIRSGHGAAVGGARKISSIRQRRLTASGVERQRLSCRRLRVQLLADQSAKEADRPFHHAGYLYLGKLITDDGNPPLGFVGTHNGAAQDWRNLAYEHSVSPQDLKYSFTGQVSYDLPVGKGQAVNLNGVGNAILGGWTVNGILYLSDGVPIASPGSGTPLSPVRSARRPDLQPCRRALRIP